MEIKKRAFLKTPVWLLLLLFVAVPLSPCRLQVGPDTTTPQAAKPVKNLEEKLKRFRLFMGAEMKRWQVPGIGVGIYKDGKILFSEGFG